MALGERFSFFAHGTCLACCAHLTVSVHVNVANLHARPFNTRGLIMDIRGKRISDPIHPDPSEHSLPPSRMSISDSHVPIPCSLVGINAGSDVQIREFSMLYLIGQIGEAGGSFRRIPMPGRGIHTRLSPSKSPIPVNFPSQFSSERTF